MLQNAYYKLSFASVWYFHFVSKRFFNQKFELLWWSRYVFYFVLLMNISSCGNFLMYLEKLIKFNFEISCWAVQCRVVQFLAFRSQVQTTKFDQGPNYWLAFFCWASTYDNNYVSWIRPSWFWKSYCSIMKSPFKNKIVNAIILYIIELSFSFRTGMGIYLFILESDRTSLYWHRYRYLKSIIGW